MNSTNPFDIDTACASIKLEAEQIALKILKVCIQLGEAVGQPERQKCLLDDLVMEGVSLEKIARAVSKPSPPQTVTYRFVNLTPSLLVERQERRCRACKPPRLDSKSGSSSPEGQSSPSPGLENGFFHEEILQSEGQGDDDTMFMYFHLDDWDS